MSSSDSVSSEKPTNPLDSHVHEIRKMVDAALRVSRGVFEHKGANKLENGKFTDAEGSKYGPGDVRAMQHKINTHLKQIKRMISEEKKREKLERKARRGTPRALAPCQFQPALVDFFKSIDLGSGPKGKRLQDDTDMSIFFKHGIGRLTFGVSLFNVWGNIQKISNGSNKVSLSDKERAHIRSALEALRDDKRKKIAAGVKGAEDDLALLEAGQLQNKDYMTILSFYRVKDASEETTKKLMDYTEHVNRMSQITKDLNTKYGEQVRAARPTKPKAERKKPVTPVRKSAPVAAAPAAKATKAAPAAKSAPAPAAKAPVASPAKGKAAAKR